MPADRATVLRTLFAAIALTAASLALISAAARDHRQIDAVVRATPTPALASAAVRP